MKTFRLTANDIDINKSSLKNLFEQSHEINFPEKKVDDFSLEDRIKSVKTYLEKGKAVVIAAKNDHHELLGFVWFFEKENEKILHVNSIVVGKPFRKHGVGKNLWIEVDKYATENAIKEIELFVTKDNEDAVKFYENRHFKVERLIMKKRL